MARFWWSNRADSSGIHWISWDHICSHFSDGGLGFRVLEDFNLALLAKQLWRLLRFPDSLLSRILKGRYFRYSSPLEISVSNRPSYGWRSLLASKAVLKHGIRKTIGSGFNTFIWTDPWIPDSPPRPPIGITGDRNPLVCVNTLIDPVSKTWRMEKLRELFPPQEIALIMGINPSLNRSRDGYSWSATKSGNYTVKSGYEVARTLSRPACDLPFQGPCVTALQAQKARNKKLFENKEESPQDTVDKAVLEAELWHQANNQVVSTSVGEIRGDLRPLPCDSLVCFIDGSWMEADARSGHGWIASTGEHDILLGLKCSPRSLSPLHSELDTLLWAMKCLIAHSVDKVIVATYCQDLVTMLAQGEDWPAFGSEIRDFSFLQHSFSEFSIRHIPRSWNFRADKLAKCARVRGFCFSHVGQSVPAWLSLEENQFR
ncbi:uncharacterized protein LOC111829456 [Capsella rubella]|uniref:uncharacterized protein LOC111829456 n=1 Tax=Capsella rubella TaxID=81985 RepID=UPI000CD53D4D|nr:uncharacterized protein LOC111829456 [Capsella rubella]